MADPARMKTEDACERTTSASEEHPKSNESEDVPAPAKPTHEHQESSSQDQAKQEVKAVSPGASFLEHQRRGPVVWGLYNSCLLASHFC